MIFSKDTRTLMSLSRASYGYSDLLRRINKHFRVQEAYPGFL